MAKQLQSYPSAYGVQDHLLSPMAVEENEELKAAGRWQDNLGLHKHWDTSQSFCSIAIHILLSKNICWFQQIHA